MCMGVSSAQISGHYVQNRHTWRSENGTERPGIGATGGYELVLWLLKQTQTNRQAPLTCEQSLQTPESFLMIQQ